PREPAATRDGGPQHTALPIERQRRRSHRSRASTVDQLADEAAPTMAKRSHGRKDAERAGRLTCAGAAREPLDVGSKCLHFGRPAVPDCDFVHVVGPSFAMMAAPLRYAAGRM